MFEAGISYSLSHSLIEVLYVTHCGEILRSLGVLQYAYTAETTFWWLLLYREMQRNAGLLRKYQYSSV